MSEFPIDGLVSCQWQINERQSKQNSTDGRGSTFEFGPPFWTVALSYDRISDQQFRSISAYFKSKRGSRGDVFIWHPQRQNPLSDSNISSATPDVGAGTIDISGGSVSLGDFIGYDASSGGKFVGEVVGISGNTISTVPPPVAGGANATLVRAQGVFRVQSLSIDEPIGQGAGRINVELKQVTP